MIDPGLAGKVVLVTGANNPHGIGAAIARAFAAQGAHVFLHYYRGPQVAPQAPTAEHQSPGEAFYQAQGAKDAGEVLASLAVLGAQAEAWEGDLADPASIPRLFDAAEAALGPVQVLVHNAAAWAADTFIPPDRELANRLVEEWTTRPGQVTAQSVDTNFAVNTRAAALLMSEFASRHIAAGRMWGRIIQLSTDAARCFPSEVSYGASKLAVESYTRSAAVELGRFGVTANVISPGAVQTGWITPAIEEAVVRSTPLGRIGRPDDIADVAVFLASEQARWVTGQVIHVGGGHRM